MFVNEAFQRMKFHLSSTTLIMIFLKNIKDSKESMSFKKIHLTHGAPYQAVMQYSKKIQIQLMQSVPTAIINFASNALVRIIPF
mmetsp:Transcript_6993/g.9378  ORF Transcript_6993/g.9378 Transcript_6993/m.9378 type:complete len:84 (+) Transcript_6993:310-561(+)